MAGFELRSEKQGVHRGLSEHTTHREVLLDPASPSADDLPSGESWLSVSRSCARRTRLATDLYFREAWNDLTAVGGEAAVEVLGRHGLLMFKPEAVAGRRMVPTLKILIANDFVPVGVARVRHTRHTMVSVWKYTRWIPQMVNWLQLAPCMYTSTDILLLILRDVGSGPVGQASKRLVTLKGPATVAMRAPWQLRARLNPPNEVLNFLHTSDEPADLLRELGIVLDREQRRAMLLSMLQPCGSSGIRSQVLKQISDVEDSCEEHNLDFDTALANVTRSNCLDSKGRAILMHAAKNGSKLRWEELCEVLDRKDRRLQLWDFVVIACATLDLG